jgi:predicted porin
MKKTLIAIAALAATSAFAQSSVSITGNVDVGYKAVTSNTAADKNTSILGGNSSTTALFFKGTEDLGGGLKANFLAELDWNAASSQTNNAAAAGNAFGGTPFNGEQFVGLSGGFGSVKLGTPNSAILETNGKAQPFGTAVGGGYSSSGLGRNGTTGKLGINQYIGGASAGNRVIRVEKAVRYDTPAVNGFAASVLYSFQNAESSTYEKNQNGYTELGLTYTNGPLNLSYATGTAKAGAYAAAAAGAPGAAVAAGNLDANGEVKHSFLAANYTIGATTVYAGATSTKSTGVTTAANIEDMSSKNVAIKYQLTPVIALMANAVTVDSKRTDNKDGKLTGLGADYMFSKRTNAYLRYETIDTNKGDAAAGKQTITAVGIRHQF